MLYLTTIKYLQCDYRLILIIIIQIIVLGCKSLIFINNVPHSRMMNKTTTEISGLCKSHVITWVTGDRDGGVEREMRLWREMGC